jgi:2-amino-4-hydroxy-6-hydroxymethyldihydropteridine diphosphokinase
MVGIYIGLGSNLGNGPEQIRLALDHLRSQPGIRVVRHSSLYRSPPWGVADQPDFTNAVAQLTTALEPLDLLQVLLDSESHLGRTRNGRRWGPRRIDLDLLCYHQQVLQSPRLQLPHPRMSERAFVLIPLLELEPEFEIPGAGPAKSWLTRLDARRVERIEAVARESREASRRE